MSAVVCLSALKYLQCAAAYNFRGNANREKGLYEQAVSDYTKALELDPEAQELSPNELPLVLPCGISPFPALVYFLLQQKRGCRWIGNFLVYLL
ncbi:MAG: tetratricopeptide repeat protein [Spirochaetaceae bacterium]|jgi:tetratricopeptide (TPR) repeat protein|nr:tetratricopeptide repeat protein [Spirochaetaceae bacterium]